MQIDNMRVAIRPMSTAQAVDLGFMMARNWFVPLWQIWMGMALPVFLVYLAVLFWDIGFNDTSNSYGSDDYLNLPFFAVLLFWWLKPLYEKPMVNWLGSALFGDAPTVKDTIKQGWKSSRQYSGKLLLRQRLSLSRQLILPILQLEHPDNIQFNHRLRLLQRGQGGGVSWHTIIMLHIEWVLSLGLIAFFTSLVPEQYLSFDNLMLYLETSERWFQVLSALVSFMAMSVVAPFFICGGFAVYLTKRCLLEGWDIELTFKQLANRYQQSRENPLNKLKQSARQTSAQTSASALRGEQ